MWVRQCAVLKMSMSISFQAFSNGEGGESIREKKMVETKRETKKRYFALIIIIIIIMLFLTITQRNWGNYNFVISYKNPFRMEAFLLPHLLQLAFISQFFPLPPRRSFQPTAFNYRSLALILRTSLDLSDLESSLIFQSLFGGDPGVV